MTYRNTDGEALRTEGAVSVVGRKPWTEERFASPFLRMQDRPSFRRNRST